MRPAGGGHRLSFGNFTTGGGHSLGDPRAELAPGGRFAYADLKVDQAGGFRPTGLIGSRRAVSPD
jgi:hypothetical protein